MIRFRTLGWMLGIIAALLIGVSVGIDVGHGYCAVHQDPCVAAALPGRALRVAARLLNRSGSALTALATVAIAFYTWALYHTTSGMLIATTDQGHQVERSIQQTTRAADAMHEVARHGAATATSLHVSAEAMGRVAEQSEASARAAHGQLVALQKQAAAHMILATPTIANIESQAGYIVDLATINGGATPAYGVSQWCACDLREFPLSASLETSRADSLSRAAVGAGNTLSQRLHSQPLTRDQIARLRQGVLAIYVWGAVKYRDVFQQNRTTTFRLMYRCVGPVPPNPMLDVCEEGNEAD